LLSLPTCCALLLLTPLPLLFLSLPIDYWVYLKILSLCSSSCLLSPRFVTMLLLWLLLLMLFWLMNFFGCCICYHWLFCCCNTTTTAVTIAASWLILLFTFFVLIMLGWLSPLMCCNSCCWFCYLKLAYLTKDFCCCGCCHHLQCHCHCHWSMWGNSLSLPCTQLANNKIVHCCGYCHTCCDIERPQLWLLTADAVANAVDTALQQCWWPCFAACTSLLWLLLVDFHLS